MPIEIYRSPPFNLQGYLAFRVRYDDGSKRTVLAHREIFEHALGRRLTSKEHVHHIDGNKLNNALLNLEVLSASDHAKEHARERLPELVEITCAWCGQKAMRLARWIRHAKNQKKRALSVGKFVRGDSGLLSRLKLSSGVAYRMEPRRDTGTTSADVSVVEKQTH